MNTIKMLFKPVNKLTLTVPGIRWKKSTLSRGHYTFKIEGIRRLEEFFKQTRV